MAPVANGGLLAALRPVIDPWDGESGTLWIGAGRGRFDREWTDADGYEVIPTDNGGLRHRRLFFGGEAWAGHYGAVANSFFWPLLHLVRSPLTRRTGYYPHPNTPSEGEWAAYEQVNRDFAVAALGVPESPACWVHDYQLALVPAMLRDAGYGGPIGFFLHTPFPDLRVARDVLDQRCMEALTRFVRGILGAGLVGLQSAADAERFIAAAVALCGAARGSEGLRFASRDVAVAAYPVGIDAAAVAAVAQSEPRPGRLGTFTHEGLPLVVGLERSDFTKGIPERLATVARAFRAGLRFGYLGVAAPTREGVPAYRGLEVVIAAAARDAAAAADAAGLPFLHTREVIDWTEVVALQREAAVVFTSSLADGMNLVPLQAVIAQAHLQPGARGVIITGRDAGVANAYAGFEKDGLVPVDPLDTDAMFSTLRDALSGRPGRVSDRLVEAVAANDARTWAARFLEDLSATC